MKEENSEGAAHRAGRRRAGFAARGHDASEMKEEEKRY
jgi:hypothetical protein